MEKSPVKERKSRSLEEDMSINTRKFEGLFQIEEDLNSTVSFMDQIKFYQSKFRYLTEYNKKKNDSIQDYVDSLKRMEDAGFVKCVGIIYILHYLNRN